MAHCLAPLVREPQGRYGLWNLRTGEPVAANVVAAFDSRSRRQGLLGRGGLAPGDALILAPCSSVHTAFMRFPLDLVFLDRAGRVLKTSLRGPALADPRGMARLRRGRASAGWLERSGTTRGDVVELRTIV